MNNREKILSQLKTLKAQLDEKFGIEEFAVFGSIARNEGREGSDVDIIILKMKRKNGFLLARAKRFLTEKLNRNVDIGLLDSINPIVKKVIEKEMIHVD